MIPLGEIGQSVQGISLLFLKTTCETTMISIQNELMPKKIGALGCFIK